MRGWRAMRLSTSTSVACAHSACFPLTRKLVLAFGYADCTHESHQCPNATYEHILPKNAVQVVGPHKTCCLGAQHMLLRDIAGGWRISDAACTRRGEIIPNPSTNAGGVARSFPPFSAYVRWLFCNVVYLCQGARAPLRVVVHRKLERHHRHGTCVDTRLRGPTYNDTPDGRTYKMLHEMKHEMRVRMFG